MLKLFVREGLILILMILFIISIQKRWDDLIIVIILLSILMFTISTITLRFQIPSEQDICEIENRYNSLKRKVEVVKTLDYSDLIKEVEEMNNLIEKHKFNCDSKWDGYFYSSKIGQLEPINLW